jgi:uncharacterized protein (TIGR02001 family)
MNRHPSLHLPGRAAALALLMAAAPAWAELSFNAGLTSDYRYRGLSQTRLSPAIQGGADWSEGPWYAGVWGSTIRWIKDAGGDAPVELDLYGGYKGEITKGLGYDLGVLTYQYPRNRLNPKTETTELYGALSYGPVTLKLSHSVSNLFGFANSKGSQYLEINASFEVGSGVTLAPHLGRQRVKNLSAASYTDYSLTASKEVLKGLSVSLALVKADSDAYLAPTNGKNLGKAGAVLGAKYSF